jgi:hypothetical protein
MMKHCFNLLLFIVFSFKICYSQELKKMQLTQKERKGKIVEKYMYSGAEESIVLLLCRNGVYSYNAFTNVIGKQFSEGTWRRTGNILELNSTYGANRLPVNMSYIQKIDSPSKMGVQNVLNSEGGVIENAIIAINNDSIKCSTIMDTCTGNFKKIERIRVFLSDECYSKWIEIDREDFKALNIVIPSTVDLDKYLAFNKRKYVLSKVGLTQINN